jgi:hypothetical protein
MVFQTSWILSDSNSNSTLLDSSPIREINDQIPPKDSERAKIPDNQSPLPKDREAEYHGGTALQFMLIKAPSRPPDKSHRKAVRSHVMRAFHSHRRKQQTLPVRKRIVLQKGQDVVPSSSESLVVKSAASASRNTIVARPQSLARPFHEPRAVNEAVISLLSPSPAPLESSNLTLHSRGSTSVVNERRVTALNRAASERANHDGSDYPNVLGFLPRFYRWLLDTSKYQLLHPCLFFFFGQSASSLDLSDSHSLRLDSGRWSTLFLSPM